MLIDSICIEATSLVRNYLSCLTDILIDNATDGVPIDFSFESAALKTLLEAVRGKAETDSVIQLFKDGCTPLLLGDKMEEVEELVRTHSLFVVTIVDGDGKTLYVIPGKDVYY